MAMTTVSRRTFLALASVLPAWAHKNGFLEDLERRAFRYFWDQSDANTGLVLDRARANGSMIRGRNLEVASTALTGFYLTALCIGAESGWAKADECRERVRQALRHLWGRQENERGWFYHFVNRKSGERVW